MHRVDDGSMKFLVSRQRNVREVLALCVSPNKRVIAVCEKGRTPEEDPGSAQVSTNTCCPHAVNRLCRTMQCSTNLNVVVCGVYKYSCSYVKSAPSLLTPQVSVYLVANCKRIRTMLFPGKGDFITCCFSGDNKWLVTAATEPEGNIVVWNWEKEKVRTCA